MYCILRPVQNYRAVKDDINELMSRPKIAICKLFKSAHARILEVHCYN